MYENLSLTVRRFLIFIASKTLFDDLEGNILKVTVIKLSCRFFTCDNIVLIKTELPNQK